MSATASADPRRVALGVWLALAAGLVAAFWGLLSFDPQQGVFRPVEGIEGVLFDPSGEDPRLIGVLAFWLLLNRRGRLAAAWQNESGRPGVAALLFVGAIAVQAWAAHVGAPDLQIHALQLFLLGGGALLAGRAGLRIVLLPVLFLFLAVPIPAAALNAVLLPLQLATVQVCTAILQLFGFEALGSGDQILTHRGIFHVVETCSGVRLVQTLLMAAVVYAELFARSARHTLLLVALAPVVGIVVNLARILSIIFNPYAAITSVHTTQGVAMVVVGVLVLAGLDRLLAGRAGASRQRDEPSAALLAHPLDARLGLIAAVLVALVAAHGVTPRWQNDTEWPEIGDLPRRIEGLRSNGRLPDLVFLGSVGFSDRIQREYAPRGEAARDSVLPITVFFGSDDHTNRRGSMLSGKTAYPGQAWQKLGVTEATLGDGTPVEVALFAHPESGRRITVHWLEGFSSPWVEALRGWSGIDRSALRRPERAFAWRVSAPVTDAGELSAVQTDLIRFASAARSAWAAAEANARARIEREQASGARRGTTARPAGPV